MKYWIQGQPKPLTVDEMRDKRLIDPSRNCAQIGSSEWKPMRDVIPEIFDPSTELGQLFAKLEDIPNWQTEMLWLELRKVATPETELSRALGAELHKRGVSVSEIKTVYPNFISDHENIDTQRSAARNDEQSRAAKISASGNNLDEIGGCLFLLLAIGILLYFSVNWIRQQESISKSIGEAAGKVTKPVRQEWEKFKDGFENERK